MAEKVRAFIGPAWDVMVLRRLMGSTGDIVFGRRKRKISDRNNMA
jgi:hypothetical protein